MAKPQRWSLVKDGATHSIRRWNGKKYERLPVDRYRRMRGDPEELRAFVSRLNYQADAEERARQTVTFKHAFISPVLMDEYREFVLAQIPTRGNALREYQATIDHFLNFFVGKLGLADPLEWHKIHKTQWQGYLTGLDRAPATLRTLIQGANRFIRWLHERRPGEVPPLKFEPISRSGFRHLKAQHELDEDKVERRFIAEEDWSDLSLPDRIRPLATLCYLYGLRRSEALALRLTDVKNGFLSVERQIGDDGQPQPLKGREPRKTPHWFSTPAEAYALIGGIEKMHPDTFGDFFGEATKRKYTLHDLRHTFITRAVRLYPVRDVMLAVGHKNIETTMKYLKDDRTLDEAIFKP